MQIKMQHSATGAVKTLAMGFDWAAFCSPFILGIPHFARGLATVGGVLLALSIGESVLMGMMTDEEQGVFLVLSLVITIGVGVYLGRIGRAQQAKRLLTKGYAFSEPESEAVKAAKSAWGMQ